MHVTSAHADDNPPEDDFPAKQVVGTDIISPPKYGSHYSRSDQKHSLLTESQREGLSEDLSLNREEIII